MFGISNQMENVRTAIYVRISTNQQKTDRQVIELLDFAKRSDIEVNPEDIFIDIISGFKNGEIRPQYSILKQRAESGVYQQILFSEFSRLDRKPSNLLKSIEYYQSKGVHLFFKKQNIWVRDKSDISTQIMISVLAVMSQYEIELFVARGIDGKISAIKNRGINDGGLTAYGYATNPSDKRLIINEYEAEILRRIFQYYDEGKSSLYISDVLNSEGIPSPYKSRIEEAVARRKAKGLPEKKYTTFAGYENMKWRPSTINRLIKNPLYIGKRDFKFYEPDPANPLPTHLREGRKLLQDFSVQADDLRIIDEAQFRRVNEMVTEKAFNRNLGVRHINLLKDLMRCGECGGHYSVSGGTAERKYRCYGTVNRTDKPKTCDKGTEISMRRLDGLVLKLCIDKFAGYNLEREASEKINSTSEIISEKTRVVLDNEEKLKREAEAYSAFARRVLKSAANDEEARQWMEEERNEYDAKVRDITAAINRANEDIIALKTKIASYTKMKSKGNLLLRQKEILSDRNLVLEYVRGFISRITVFRVSKLWSLVVISFMDGGERWGTIKVFRYKTDEVVRDTEDPSQLEYQAIFINNDGKSASYDKRTGLFSISKENVLYEGDGPEEMIPFEEFQQRAHEKGLVGTFPPYHFEIKEH